MSTGDRWTLGHRVELDGLRGLAIVGVLLYHAEVPGLVTAGTVGVTVFFTLSGFLITSLLLAERERTGRLDLVGFYLRRLRRLAPALLVCVVAVVAVAAVLGPAFATSLSAATAVTYTSNWAAGAGVPLGALTHTWSLSVEEQFYLAWPLLLILTRGRRGLVAAVAIAGSLAAVAVRMAAWDGGAGLQRVYYSTDARADGLLLGCLLAMVMSRMVEGRSRPRLAVAALVALVPLCVMGGYAGWVIVPGVVAVLSVVVLFAVARGDGVSWLRGRGLVWLGERSYAVYLWNWPIAVALDLTIDLPWYAVGVVVAGGSVLCAAWSYRYVETPFRRPRVSSSPRATVSPSATTARAGSGVSPTR